MMQFNQRQIGLSNIKCSFLGLRLSGIQICKDLCFGRHDQFIAVLSIAVAT